MSLRSSLALFTALCLAGAVHAQEGEEPVRSPDTNERQLIGEYIRAHITPLRTCYERRIVAVPSLNGRMMARFDITDDGKVDKATVDGMPDRELVACVVAEIASWKFARSAAGRLRVAYPLLFKQG